MSKAYNAYREASLRRLKIHSPRQEQALPASHTIMELLY